MACDLAAAEEVFQSELVGGTMDMEVQRSAAVRLSSWRRSAQHAARRIFVSTVYKNRISVRTRPQGMLKSDFGEDSSFSKRSLYRNTFVEENHEGESSA